MAWFQSAYALIPHYAKWRAADFEWFTGGADRSEKAREDRGKKGIIVSRWKSDDVKVARKLETFNLLYTNFKMNWIPSAPVELGNEWKTAGGGQ